MLEDVVGVELGHRGDLDPLDVPGTPVEDRVLRPGRPKRIVRPSRVRRSDIGPWSPLDDDGLGLGQVGAADRPEGLGDDLGLGLLARGQAVDDQGLTVLELGEEGHPDRGPDRLLGHRVAIVAVSSGEGDTAADPLVGPLGAGPGVARPLLAEELLARARDVGAAAWC